MFHITDLWQEKYRQSSISVANGSSRNWEYIKNQGPLSYKEKDRYASLILLCTLFKSIYNKIWLAIYEWPKTETRDNEVTHIEDSMYLNSIILLVFTCSSVISHFAFRSPDPVPPVLERDRVRDEADICDTTRLKKFRTDSDDVLALRLLREGLWFPSCNQNSVRARGHP